MHGIIYLYTNTLSGLVYVGQTINPQSRQRDYARDVASTRPNPRCIIQAMRHAGLNAFTYQVLAEASTKDELTCLEIHYIAALQANNPQYGYNRTTGGQHGSVGHAVSAETRAKMSRASRARLRHPLSAEHRAKLSLAHRGRTNSAETRAKLSLANRGRICSAETRAKIGHGNRGKIVSEETRAKLSLAGRGNRNRTGCTHSEETTAI